MADRKAPTTTPTTPARPPAYADLFAAIAQALDVPAEDLPARAVLVRTIAKHAAAHRHAGSLRLLADMLKTAE